MIRAVFDTNVLVSALLAPRGAPATLIGRWHAGEFDLVVSNDLLTELSAVLKRPKFREYVTSSEIAAWVALLGARAVRADDPPDPPRVSRDPADDFVVALVLTSKAILVTGDTRLAEVRERGLAILSPRSFLEALDG